MLEKRLLQVYPTSITLTNNREPLQFHDVKFNSQCPSWYKEHSLQAIENFDVVKNPFIISKASKRKIMRSINSMYMLSKPRKIEMKNKKFIYNYRMSFITLTLPSVQNHSDVLIKKQCLNQLLVELRKHYSVKNYLWKAELQKNDNIHFHLLTDQYIDFQALRRRWNRILEKLNYVSAYQSKMSALSLNEYHLMRCKNTVQTFESSKNAYAQGKKSNWSNPNTVDVRSVYSKRELGAYLAKYIVKPILSDALDSETNTRQTSFGRAWFRSYSLSSLKYMNKYLSDEMKNLISYLRSKKDEVLEINNQFYTVFYFSSAKLSKGFNTFLNNFLFANAKIYNYPFPVP